MKLLFDGIDSLSQLIYTSFNIIMQLICVYLQLNGYHRKFTNVQMQKSNTSYYSISSQV